MLAPKWPFEMQKEKKSKTKKQTHTSVGTELLTATGQETPVLFGARPAGLGRGWVGDCSLGTR